MAKIKDYISTSIFLSRFKCRKRKIPSIPESEDSLFQGFLYEHITIDLLQQEDNVIVFGNNTIEGTPDGGIDFQGYIGYTYENICVRMFGQCKSSFKPVKSKYIKAFINLLQEKKKLVEVMTGFPAYGIFAATRLPNSQNLKLFEEAPVPMSWLIVSKPDINTENPYDITGYSIDDSKRIYHNASALRLLKDLKERSTNPEFFLKNSPSLTLLIITFSTNTSEFGMNYIVGNKGVANYLKMSLIRSIYERKLTSMSEIPIKDIKNINNIKNVKDVKDIKDIRNILDVKNIRNFKNPNDIKGIKDVQKRSDSKPSVKIIDFPFPPIPTIFNSSKFLVPDPQTSQSDSSENQSSSSQPGLLEVQPSSSVLSQVRSLLSICSSAQKPSSMLSQIEPPSSKISPHQLPPFTMPQIHPPQSVLSLFQLSNIDLPNFQLSEPHPSGFSNTSDLLKKWNMENREFSESNNYIKGALFESITLDLFDTGEFNVTGKPGGGPDGGIDFKGFATQGDETVSVIGQCKNYNRKLSTTPLADLIEVLEKNTLKTIDGTTRLPHGFMVTTFDPSDSVLKLFMNSPFPLSWITIPRPHAGLENPYQIENHTIYPPTSIYHNISAVQLWSDVMDLESKRLHSELTSLLGPGWESTHNMDIEGFVIAGDKVFAIEVGDKVSAIEAGDKISAVKA